MSVASTKPAGKLPHQQMIGSIGEFNSYCDDWNVYYERLEQYLDVNDVPEAKRSAFLISVIGSDAYKSLRDLCHPVVPKDKPFADLCELLKKQYTPQIAIFRERTKFYNSRQAGHENVTQWYGNLKRLSVDCKFGANLEAVLLDKFITGLRPGQVLDRLCEETELLKLDRALEIAVNKECAAKENAYSKTHEPIYGGGGLFPSFSERPRGCFFTQKMNQCASAPEVVGFGAPAASPCVKPARLAACSGLFGGSGGGGGGGLEEVVCEEAAYKTMSAQDEPAVMQAAEEECELGAADVAAAAAAATTQQKARRVRARRRGKARRGSACSEDRPFNV